MKVKNFLKAFGVDKIEGKAIMKNGRKYFISFKNEYDKSSFLLPNWPYKERLIRFIEKGSYRLVAINEDGFSIWVYPDDILIDITKSKPCSLVLKIMDEDIDYQKALNIALSIFEVDRAELEQELDLYI